MKNKIRLFLAGGAILSLFVFFSYLVHKDLFTQFDFDITVKLQDNLPRRVDELFSVFSIVGSFEIATVVLLILLAIRRKLLAIFTLFFWGAFHVIELFGKTAVEHLPPPEFLLRTERLIEFPQFHVRSEFSYPSGHAGRAAFLSVLIGLLVWQSKKLSKTQKIIIISFLVFYDIVMFVSRAYLGEHWASDVIGGAILGAGLALLSVAIL